MMTSKPNSRSCLAAIKPDIPAPITIILPFLIALLEKSKYILNSEKSPGERRIKKDSLHGRGIILLKTPKLM